MRQSRLVQINGMYALGSDVPGKKWARLCAWPRYRAAVPHSKSASSGKPGHAWSGTVTTRMVTCTLGVSLPPPDFPQSRFPGSLQVLTSTYKLN